MEWRKIQEYDHVNKPEVLVKCLDGYFLIGRIFEESTAYWCRADYFWHTEASNASNNGYFKPWLIALEWNGLD